MSQKCDVINMSSKKKRSASLSLKQHGGGAGPGPGEAEREEEELHLCMAPHIQALLARGHRRSSCCGLAMPVPFERAANNSLFNPKFDSEILEGQYKSSTFTPIRLRFRYTIASLSFPAFCDKPDLSCLHCELVLIVLHLLPY